MGAEGPRDQAVGDMWLDRLKGMPWKSPFAGFFQLQKARNTKDYESS